MAYESRKTKDRQHWIRMKHDALAKRAEGKTLTLEETAVAIWDPKTEKRPMTCMGMLKFERRVLDKIRRLLRDRYGIKNLSDVCEPRYREYGKPI